MTMKGPRPLTHLHNTFMDYSYALSSRLVDASPTGHIYAYSRNDNRMTPFLLICTLSPCPKSSVF